MALGGSYANRRVEEAGTVLYRERYKQPLIYSNPMGITVLLTQDVEEAFTPGMLVPGEEYQASSILPGVCSTHGLGRRSLDDPQQKGRRRSLPRFCREGLRSVLSR